MSSLLTNTSAMVALQTLKGVNKNLAKVQDAISTGKQIANARDNAAIWSISTTMQTDVSGFKAISESLSLGTATLTVGRDAAEQIVGVLDQLKGRIVAAQEENVDRSKIQADVVALRDQIGTIVAASQFNGLRLLESYAEITVLASLNRDEQGDVTSTSIAFRRHDLTTTAGVFGAGTDLSANITAPATNAGAPRTAAFTVTGAATAAGVGRITVGGVDVAVAIPVGTVAVVASAFVGAINDNPQLKALGVTATATGGGLDTVTLSSVNSFDSLPVSGATQTGSGATFGATAPAALAARAETVTFLAVPVAENDSYRLQVGALTFDYVAGDGETMTDVAAGLARLVNGDAAAARLKITAQADVTVTPPRLLVDNGSGASVAMADDGRGGGTRAGGLRGLEAMDVTTKEGAAAALNLIEGLIQTSIRAASAFGSAQGRIQTQTEFISKVMDGLTTGIGALVDADMEASSAKLQALQVQQQLGIQALSIANQNPQTILALFRQ
jgi:flagellin